MKVRKKKKKEYGKTPRHECRTRNGGVTVCSNQPQPRLE